MKNIIVTGGAGYIGTSLTRLLLENGYAVTCLDRFYFGVEFVEDFINNENYSLVKKDVTHVVPKDLEGYDVVIDLAGISNDPACDLDEELTKRINFEGTVNIAQCAKAAGVKRYILASSCSIYGANDGAALTEISIQNPVSLYAKSKVDAEREILPLESDAFSVTFLRLATVFGLSNRMRFDLIINIMTMYAVKRGRIMVLGGGQQWRPLVHVRDVARAFKCVVESPLDKVSGQAFNVGSSEQNMQVLDVANLIKNTLPIPVEIEMVPDDPDKRNYNVDFEKINRILGYKTEYDVVYGIKEIFREISAGRLNTDNLKYYTLNYYRYLIDADDALQKIKLEGRVFL